MHALLSRLIGCYAYSAICIRITILIIRAPPLTIVGRAHGSARTAVPCMCALLFTQSPPMTWRPAGLSAITKAHVLSVPGQTPHSCHQSQPTTRSGPGQGTWVGYRVR